MATQTLVWEKESATAAKTPHRTVFLARWDWYELNAFFSHTLCHAFSFILASWFSLFSLFVFHSIIIFATKRWWKLTTDWESKEKTETKERKEASTCVQRWRRVRRKKINISDKKYYTNDRKKISNDDEWQGVRKKKRSCSCNRYVFLTYMHIHTHTRILTVKIYFSFFPSLLHRLLFHSYLLFFRSFHKLSYERTSRKKGKYLWKQ